MLEKVIVLSLFIFQVIAITHYVSPQGTDNITCGSQNSPCNTINYVVSNASSNDIINLDMGNFYVEESIEININLTFQGISGKSFISSIDPIFAFVVVNTSCSFNSIIFKNISVINLINSICDFDDLQIVDCNSPNCIFGNNSLLNISNSIFYSSNSSDAFLFGDGYLKNVTFFNLTGDTISSFGNITLDGCIFDTITGDTLLNFNGFVLTISNSKFTNIYSGSNIILVALTPNPNPILTQVYVYNSIFNNITAAITLYYYTDLIIAYFNDSIFSNFNNFNGPVIEFANLAIIGFIDNCSFINNTAISAIDFEAINLTITNSKFLNNFGYYYSGAISITSYYNNINIFIQNTIFENNISPIPRTSGVISLYNGFPIFSLNISVDNCTFLHNFGYEAGVLFIPPNMGINEIYVSIYNSIVEYNSGISYSIFSYPQNITLDVANNTIIDNFLVTCYCSKISTALCNDLFEYGYACIPQSNSSDISQSSNDISQSSNNISQSSHNISQSSHNISQAVKQPILNLFLALPLLFCIRIILFN